MMIRVCLYTWRIRRAAAQSQPDRYHKGGDNLGMASGNVRFKLKSNAESGRRSSAGLANVVRPKTLPSSSEHYTPWEQSYQCMDRTSRWCEEGVTMYLLGTPTRAYLGLSSIA